MRWFHAMSAAALVLGVSTVGRSAEASPTREQYRLFRALSIDLQGRIPLAEEITAFEQPGFVLDAWIDQHLQGPAYAERLRACLHQPKDAKAALLALVRTARRGA